MILPKELRLKADELFCNDNDKIRIFCMGAAFALGKDLSDFETENPPQEAYPLQDALNVWLAYKRERHQTYKSKGLEMVKKRLLQLSNGIPDYAMQIVEFSIANNYAGLYAPKDNNANSYARQQQSINKAAAILAE